MDKSTQNTNLFEVLQRGDQTISLIEQQAIVLVGLTRSGKSTTFNWILNKNMRGAKDKNGISYVVAQKDQECATMASGYKSVTLVPNIFRKYLPGISLVDMAGFKDSRDHVGVVGVSYFLKYIFSKVRKVKFLIVMTENQIHDETGGNITKNLNSFINMFDLQSMSPTQLQKFKNSLAIVATKSTPGADHYENLNTVISRLEDEDLVVPKKDLIVDLLKHITQNNMIENFDKAIENVSSPPCDLVQRFQKMNWNYFDLDQAEKEIGKSVITIPFTKDFQSLEEPEKHKLEQAFEKKISSIKRMAQSIGILTDCFRNSWARCLERWSDGEKINQNVFDMSQFFIAVDELLEQHDDYNIRKTLEKDKLFQKRSQEIIPSIENIIQIHKIINHIGTTYNEIPDGPQTIEWYGTIIPKIFKAMNYFSSNKEEQHKILCMEYVILTGLKQMGKIYELNRYIIHGIKQDVPDQLNSVLEQQQTIRWQVICDLKEKYLTKAFPDLHSLEQYENFFGQFFRKFGEDHPDQLTISKTRCSICFAKAEILCKINQKKAAVQSYIGTLLQIKQIIQLIPDSSLLSEQEKQEQINSFYIKNYQIIQKAALLLKDIPSNNEDFLPKIEAIRLCKHYKNVHIAIQIYESIINDSSADENFVKTVLDQYVDYAIQNGRFWKAVQLLQQKLSMTFESIEEQQDISNKIKEIYENQTDLMSVAKKNVLDLKTIPIDSQYEMILNDIMIKLSW